jgi:hypothetical protein
MPQLSGAHVSIVEGADVPDMVKTMVEQEVDMHSASEEVQKIEARLAGIHLGQSQLRPGQAIEDVEAALENGVFYSCI